MLYVDPSAGSVFVQIAFAAVVGGALTVRRWWGAFRERVLTGIRGLRRR